MNMDKVEYRQFREEDAQDVLNVAKKAWNYTYKGIFRESFIEKYLIDYYSQQALCKLLPEIEVRKQFFCVAVNNLGVIGYSHIAPREQIMELCRIYLLPEYIGKGIGRKLVELGEEFIKSKGCRKYFCYLHKQNKTGKTFYIKSGFIHIPEKDLNTDEIEDCHFYMEKIIE